MKKKNRRIIIPEDLYRIELITDLHLSPDGKHVVYSQQRVDRKTEKKFSNLYVVSTSGGKPRRFTWGDQADTHPRWSPDGKCIAFISNRLDERQAQVYIIPFDGGEARKLTGLSGTIAGFEWSPDGSELAMTFRRKDAELVEMESDQQKKQLGIVARRYDRPFYKADGEGLLPKERWHIWTIDASSGRTKQLTDSEVFDEHGPIWSPDGRHILFTSNRSPDPDIDIYAIDFHVIPRKGGKPRKLNAPAGVKHAPSFSPDGKRVAYLGIKGKGHYWRNNRVWIVPSGGSGEARAITSEDDFDVSTMTINDVIGALHIRPPTWSNDGKHIYFQAGHCGNVSLKRVNIEGKSGVEDVINDAGAVGSYMFDAAQDKLCYYFADMHSPGQVYIRNMKSGASRKLTHVNERWLRSVDMGEMEEVWFTGAAKNRLQGWMLKPPGFNARRKYPAILQIHGGPWVQYGNLMMHEFYCLAASGYVVFFSNPRGGKGYGEAHAKAIVNKWGGPDYDDLMAWTDYVARRRYIDKDRLGVTGGSYGGYMTNWIIGHTDRFKAAVTQRCVSNLLSFWGTSDFNWIFQEMFADKPPWEDFQNMWKQSPMKYMGNVKTPTLVIHSEADHRAPIEQAEQVFVALRTRGVETEFVRFPNEPHGLSRSGRTDRRIKRLEFILGWFDKYLKGKRDPG